MFQLIGSLFETLIYVLLQYLATGASHNKPLFDETSPTF